MDRRTFLRRASILAAGIVAADQIELLEMLAPRRLFPSIALSRGNTIVGGPTTKLWRKVQGVAVEGINFEVTELDLLRSGSRFLPGSRRSVDPRLRAMWTA